MVFIRKVNQVNAQVFDCDHLKVLNHSVDNVVEDYGDPYHCKSIMDINFMGVND